MDDISKLLHVISEFETILKCHEWYLKCQIQRTNLANICLYYYRQKVCNFHMWVFQIKLKYLHCSKPCIQIIVEISHVVISSINTKEI